MNTINPTVVPIELPRLSRDNFDECRSRFGWQDIDEELVDQIFDGFELRTRVTTYKREDVLEDGEPTEWTVVERDGDRWPQSGQRLGNDLPCSYDWCQGHDITEGESWDDLRHATRDVKVETRFVDFTASWSVHKGNSPKLDFYLNYEGEFDPDSLPALREDLTAALNFLDALSVETKEKGQEVS